ncbi:hypothetical protein [Engelhardtia mirabilis]|uniref:Uncharacterized protein n=1 Tax=Engelhardtia mirabilis TaxID=2528011 RepID=A0A518BG11_9BACT|nr:hypothetical protein Pla133_09190 [Planctomycetes bacterium Pla133]QDV00179.1 hypothetical protein Pla86_09180 [Planctomycetes bacterium Pla86]
MTVLRVEDRPRLGPYCCFTGQTIRPWYHRLLFGLYHLATAVALVMYMLEALADNAPVVYDFAAGVGGAVIYLLCVRAPRIHAVTLVLVFAIATQSAVETFGEEQPLDLAGLPGWIAGAEGLLERSDEFLLQAAKTTTFTSVAAIHALVTLIPLGVLVAGLLRSRRLPQRLWFARFHPVWRRRYTDRETPHPFLGVLAVMRDPLLAEKLVWLQLPPGTDALRIGARGTLESATDPRVPLAEQLGDLVLFRERGLLHANGPVPSGGHAELRTFLEPLNPAGHMGLGERVFAEVDSLPVRDLHAEENALFGKHRPNQQRPRLFGLLLDSRPNVDAEEPGLPRFVVLLETREGIVTEYGHPDLETRAPIEFDGRQARLPWRTADEEGTALRLVRGVDSVHGVTGPGGHYQLLFVSFGAGNGA